MMIMGDAETEYELSTTSTSIVDNNGNAIIQLGPVGPHERWELNRYNTIASFSVQCGVYVNFVADSNFVDGTITGDNDSGGIQITLRRGECLWFVYSQGSPGDHVTARIFGRRYVAGDRAYRSGGGR